MDIVEWSIAPDYELRPMVAEFNIRTCQQFINPTIQKFDKSLSAMVIIICTDSRYIYTSMAGLLYKCYYLALTLEESILPQLIIIIYFQISNIFLNNVTAL